MKKYILFFILFSGLVFAQRPAKVALETAKMKFWMHQVVQGIPSEMEGTLPIKAGKILFTEDGKVKEILLKINIRSMEVAGVAAEEQTGLADRLKSFEYFYAKKFPYAEMKIKSIIPSKTPGEFNSIVTADLTLRGKRKTVSFPANVTINKEKVTFHSDVFRINRQAYDIFYRSSRRDVIIKDEMDLKIDFESL